MIDPFSEDKRKEVFRTLVEMQDEGGCTVEDSRTRVAAQFGINDRQLRGIEQEGLAKKWEPL